MNGSILKYRITHPVRRPTPAPTHNTIAQHSTGCKWNEMISLAIRTVQSTTTPATDRSMPPEMMTMVMPTATIPMGAL